MSVDEQQQHPQSSKIDPDSYTSLRLRHASPEHIHLTARRCFIGPIPEGWLKSHRKTWYRQYISRNYSSKAATFTAPVSKRGTRQITGLDGPSTSVAFAQAFPQPEDLGDEEEEGVRINIARAEGSGLQSGSEGLIQNDAESAEAGGGGDKQRSLLNLGGLKPGKKQRRKSSTEATSRLAHSRERSSLVAAPLRRKAFLRDSTTSPPPSSFHTAHSFDQVSRRRTEAEDLIQDHDNDGDNAISQPRYSGVSSSQPAASNDNVDSKTALLDQNEQEQTANRARGAPQQAATGPTSIKAAPGLVKFDTHDLRDQDESSAAVRLNKAHRRRSWKRFRKEKQNPGAIVKAEKMLVRVEQTMQELVSDYDENGSVKVETRIIEKWREFVIVCRESTNEEDDFTLQLYKTRVIPATAQTNVQGRSTHGIPLSHKKTRVNLYSSLDKTLVICVPWGRATLIYILRTRSAASAVEWYTFLRQSLGWQRSTQLQVNVPDLSVSLRLDNPFEELEASISEAQRAKSDEAALKTIEAEKAVSNMIIQQAIDALKGNPEWANVLDAWLAKEKIGLAWKRYDRLEWVHGAHEQKMYGTLGMQRTHELELRPKDHYPTGVKTKQEALTEPAPVEGFLIRLTSQKGNVRRLGRMYFKRLYFTTHNQYFCYSRPARALPPPPPRMPEREDSRVPSAGEIVDNSPLIYSVNPFPVHDGQIEWLKNSNAIKSRHDEEAYKESKRKIKSMLQAEGYINLLHVSRVQNATRGNSVADANMDEGSDVDFHEEVSDTPRDDGKVGSFDDDRTFELVMKNKLVIRLQAYDEQTKREWIHRLRGLVRYWKLRLKDDMHLLKSIRDQNLERLGIDEEMEASLGQFASKWEVTRSVASPKIFHMCGISCCRAITMAGTLYHKPKRRSTFLRSGVILCHSKLLIFHGTLRKNTGEEVPHIQHNRRSVIDLQNCYVYSGLLTEGDLLYQNRTFDANHPGHHALPKVYLEDGWTTIDEDTMTTFVIWQPRNKSWFRANEEDAAAERPRQRLRHVSRLGVPGRSIVFKARSRAERDHWVMSIAVEMERMQGGEDIRVVNK